MSLIEPRQASGIPLVRGSDNLEPLLTRYVEGWAEVNLFKIIASVSEDYVFIDPLVGSFSRQSLSHYVGILHQRAGLGTVHCIETKVYLGVMAGQEFPLRRLFWRSLPECGLSGTSAIQLRAGRVTRELVSYDLNIAAEQLRCPS